jgi:hypothetical protein
MVIDLTGLPEAMRAQGYDFELLRAAHPFAVFGSRAAKCHHIDSDWDVIALAPHQLSDRSKGLDFLIEDPPNDSYWYARDLAFHLSGYAVWLNGGPNWDPALLDWDRAIYRKTKKVREIALTLGRHTMNAVYETKWMIKLMAEAGRVVQLRQGKYISPTGLLPVVSIDDFRALRVDDSFLRRLETLKVD